MLKKNKVLMVVENLSVPADPRVWREAKALSQYGYHVCIICPQGETRDRELYTCIDGIDIYRYPLSMTINKPTDYIKEYLLAMFRTLLMSFTVLRRHGFDVIHAANPPDTFFAMGLFYKLLGKKFVFDQHDLTPEIFQVRFANRLKPLHKLVGIFERCSYAVANVVITTNESQKRNAIERGHCQPEKVFVVRNGPDLTRFNSVVQEPELKMGRRFLLAYIGVMGVQDGVEYVIHAMDELVNKRGRQDVALVLMGTGDQLAMLQKLTHDLQLEPYVHFVGWLAKPDMLRYLSVTDVGLSPDPSNVLNDRSTMLKTMDYMAMGRPIVAFDLPETHFSAQDAALYATPNRAEEFADHIETLLGDEDLRVKMGAAGRKRVEDLLCWDRTKQNLWWAYQALFPENRDTLMPADITNLSPTTEPVIENTVTAK